MVASKRRRLSVQGIVQGVGFRPFVYNLAARHGLAGYVLNDSTGVVIEVEGPPEALDRFGEALVGERPPLAVIDNLRSEDVAPVGSETSFEIRHSAHVGPASALISADFATCDDCLAEIRDPSQRRFRYAFTNCTNCGPRFTISTGIPYDRPNTTMAPFAMCDDCRAEYENPADRRFHAQPIACPACGPHLALLGPSGAPLAGDPIREAARRVREGEILAAKGLGGYHLICAAESESAVGALRSRKAREEKPLAVMAADLGQACDLVDLNDAEAEALVSARRPIVIGRRRAAASVAEGVAPRNRYLGVMLPYTPLHHLLLAEVGSPIVCTSGNLSDEPIAYRDDDAGSRLSGIADLYLTHDREIHMRCDDSVVRVLEVAGERFEQPIRRARGSAPAPISVAEQFRDPVLAVGPELKHTFCIGTGNRAIISHHLGDLENWETMRSFLEGVEHYQRVFEVHPGILAYDLHPEYLVTKWALDQPGVELFGVQHHHAHIASCLADNHRSEQVVGLALDGTGYGDDGNLWGCEVLACDLADYRRVAHLEYLPMPGGAMAISQPWRMAAVYLDHAFGADADGLELDFVRRTAARWAPILKMAATGLNSPLTSGAGRLFDAAASVLGLADEVSYEGQAAIELEQRADPEVADAYPCPVEGGRIRGAELVAALASDVAAGRELAWAAAAFHNGFARALVAAAALAAEENDLSAVALSGGTFQNQLLVSRVAGGLRERGLEVLLHRRVPPNDGGISLGQAVVANARRAGS